MKVGVLGTGLPHYRVFLYDRLAEDLDWDVTALLTIRDHKVGINLESSRYGHAFSVLSFSGLHVPLRMIPFKGYHYQLNLNPGIVPHLVQTPYDLLILSGYSTLTQQLALITARFRGIPVVLWMRSFDIKSSKPTALVSSLLTNIKKYSILKSRAFVVPGERSRSYLLNLGVPPHLIRVVGNPVKNCSISKLSLGSRKILKRANNSTTVLYVGHLSHRKGLDILLKAFRQIKERNLTLEIVGDGPLKNEVLRARETDCRIGYHGLVSPNEMIQYYHEADMLVLPSRYDLWGLVINEAMNAGLPIITTDCVGAAGDLVQDGYNGYVLQSEDSRALALAISRLHCYPRLRQDMGDASRLIMREWGIDKAIRGFEEAAKIATLKLE